MIHGVWMGFFKVSGQGVTQLYAILSELLANPIHQKAGMATLFQELLRTNHPIRVLYTVGHWLDINNLEDVVQAGSFSESF
jgi:phosphoenolpyruvate phosphomutase